MTRTARTPAPAPEATPAPAERPTHTVAWESGGFRPDGTATGGTCRCGCGADVPAGARFRQGHDARAKGAWARAAADGHAARLVRDGAVVAEGDAAEVALAALACGAAPVGTPASVAGALARAADREARAAKRASEKEARDAARAATPRSAS